MRTFLNAAVLLCALAVLAMHSADICAEPMDWKNGWNTWKTSHKGDWVEYGSEFFSTRYEVTGVDAGPKISYIFKNFDASGKEISSKQYTNKDWSSIKLNGKLPYKLEVTWTTSQFTLGGTKLECDVASWVSGQTAQSVWYSKDVPCGGVVRQTTNGRDIVWLTGFESKRPDAEAKSSAVPAKLPRFYQTVGNSAVYRISSGDTTAWQLHTVKSIAADHAVYTTVDCDKDGKPLEGKEPAEHKLLESAWKKDHSEAAQIVAELEVAAGTYKDCSVFRYKSGETDVESFVGGGLILKSVRTTGETSVVMELAKVETK